MKIWKSWSILTKPWKTITFQKCRTLYSGSVTVHDKHPYDQTRKGFPVVIKAGTASTSLTFQVPIERDKMETYADFAFALKIKETGNATLSRQYYNFMVSELNVDLKEWSTVSGFPIPEIPTGRYLSARLLEMEPKIPADGRHRKYKYITPLGDTPELKGKYIIWGTGVWVSKFAYHGAGWCITCSHWTTRLPELTPSNPSWQETVTSQPKHLPIAPYKVSRKTTNMILKQRPLPFITRM